MWLKNLKILFKGAIFIFAVFNLAGCSNVKYTQIKELEPLKEPIEIQSPQGSLRIGETLTYQAHWSGVPVGTLVTKVEAIEDINGYPCYHLVVMIKSNRWLSTEFAIPPLVQDEVTSFFYCRLKDLDVSKPINFFVTLNEKNYSLEAKIIESGIIEIKNLSRWNVVVFSPGIKLANEPVSKVKILFWLSTDPERLPIMLKARTPVFGSVNLILSGKN